MTLDLFWKGFILGFSVSAPVGPIGILCIRRTLEYGKLSGFFTGLGAAFADIIYAILALFGLSFITQFIITEQFWLRLTGGIFLLYLGYKTYQSNPHLPAKNITHTSLVTDFFSTFFLMITNPLTLIAFLAVFAGLGLSTYQKNSLEMIEIVLGVFTGSATWWLTLSEFITLFRKKVSKQLQHWINLIAGLIIISFGLIILLTLFNL